MDQLIKELIENPDQIDNMTDEQVEETMKSIKFYNTITYKPCNKFTCFSITNLKERYLKRLIMISLKEFLYKMLEEYNGVDDKVDIKNFLDSLLEFNEDYHLKASSPDNAIPADTYHKWNNYLSANYETLRQKVEDQYAEKADLEYVINVYDSFKTEEEATNFVNLYKDEFVHDVFTSSNNNWVFLGDFRANREKIDFYNKNNEILKKIMTQLEEDKKTGQELLKKRVGNLKRRDARKLGPVDSTKIKSIAEQGGFSNFDADTVANNEEIDLNKKDDPFLPPLPLKREDEDEDYNRIENVDDNDECPDNAVQLDVFEVDNVDVKKSRIFIEKDSNPF